MASQQLAVSFECIPVREINCHRRDQSPAVAIVETVAELENVDPDALSPLYESVDPDALAQLVEHAGDDSDGPLSLCFTYHGWNVFVRGDGTIIVGDPDEIGDPTPLF